MVSLRFPTLMRAPALVVATTVLSLSSLPARSQDAPVDDSALASDAPQDPASETTASESSASESSASESSASESSASENVASAATENEDIIREPVRNEVTLPVLFGMHESELLWAVPATGAALMLVASSISLVIGGTNFLRYEGSRQEILALSVSDDEFRVAEVRGEFEERRRAYDDVGRGLLGAGLLKLTAGVALLGLASAAYYWRSLDEGALDLDRAANVGDSSPRNATRAPANVESGSE